MPLNQRRLAAVGKLCLLLGMSSPLAAQDGQPNAQADTAEAERPGGTLVPLPALFYQTETGLGFGAAITYFLPPPTDSGNGPVQRDQASQLQLFAIYTTKKQTAIQFGAELYPSGGKFRLLGSVTFVKFPTKYWGIGNNTPDAAEEDFTPLSFVIDGDFQREIRPSWYAGLLGQFVIRNLDEVEPGGLLDSGNTPGAEDGRIVGLGAGATWDTRSSTIWPVRGGYHQLRALFYDGFFGSDFDFGTISLDLRGYFTILPGTVLAVRALGVTSTSTPPFDFMPQLGGDRLVRGYFAGRFRDDNLLALQAEYRFPVWRRFGAVAFGSAGQVAPTLGTFATDAFRPAAGFGVRFLLNPERMLNVRADFAWGFHVGSTGFYLGIGETF